MFRVNNDLLNIILSYDYRIPPEEFIADLEFYTRWQRVPPLFLSASLIDTRILFHVANPCRKHHPFTPRRHLKMRPCDIWAATLPALVHMVCRERLRELKTYKKCCLNWTYDCVENHKLWYYEKLESRLLTRLQLDHFRPSAQRAFVIEALRQIAFSSS